ncbi:MAG: GNAT family N-acetyltransferase [Paracoccaceae bacterium]
MTRENLDGLFKLKVAPGQEDLVSPAPVTLARQAYTPGAHVWGIWAGETAVGVIGMIHTAEFVPLDGRAPRKDTAYVWRLLVDGAHQGNGYGRAALAHACDVAEGWGYARLSLTVADEPHSNIGFYEALGFTATGEVDTEAGELELMADVATVRARTKR